MKDNHRTLGQVGAHAADTVDPLFAVTPARPRVCDRVVPHLRPSQPVAILMNRPHYKFCRVLVDDMHVNLDFSTKFNVQMMQIIAGLEKSAAIRPFATKKSRLASEKILLADSLATESCRLADRLATKLFFKADNADADRT